MANPKIVVPKLWDLSLGIQDPKTFKRVIISESLFRDFQVGINQIDHDEYINPGPETQGSMLFDSRQINLKIVKST